MQWIVIITMYHSLFDNVTPNTLILTVNSRLSRHLHAQYDRYQQSLNKPAWETPTILPLQTWLTQQFHLTNSDNHFLLTAFQAECIWQDIIQSSQLAKDIAQPAQMAKLVKQAHDLLQQWQVPLAELEPYAEQNETRCLITWIHLFEKRCAEKKWITESALPAWIQTQGKFEQRSSKVNHILLMGFDDISPALQALIHYLESFTRVIIPALPFHSESTIQTTLSQTRDEIDSMAKWIKYHFEKNPTGQLGCIIPDIEKQRQLVERIFSNYFERDQFNISAGIPLTQHHLIQTAIQILNWCESPMPIENVAYLLQSPYFCENETEKNIGAQIDAYLRQQNKLQVHIIDLYQPLSVLTTQCGLLSQLRILSAYAAESATEKLSPSRWAQRWIDLLHSIGWPGQHTQNTAEFQVLERFKKIMLSFSQLNFIYGTLTHRRALSLLISLMQQTIFQAKSHDEPIQIMGTLEASTIIFDAVWIMGLHDGVWPATTKPHPLIPYPLQQHYQMPHATAKRELLFCERMTKRLENAAKYVVFSSPSSEGEQHLFPSRLLSAIPMVTADQLTGMSTISKIKKMAQHQNQITLEDEHANPVSDFTAIRGGTDIIKLQALCPFRAFATIRLHAKPLSQPIVGMTPMMKGILMHHVLFKIGETITDHATLCALSETELTEHIDNAIHSTMIDNKVPPSFFYDIEKKRLQQLIRAWLLFEKNRPFFRIVEREVSHTITVNQLPLQIRLDRIDQLEDGSLLLIDYKSRPQSISGWFQERIKEPQLPLYAAFLSSPHSPFAGVTFASVQMRNMKFSGLIHETHLYANNKTMGLIPINVIKNAMERDTWEKAIQTWKRDFEKLANDFSNGKATVDPLDPTVCASCDLKPVCRYHEYV